MREYETLSLTKIATNYGGLRTMSHKKKIMIRLNSMTEEEKTYWGLILMVNYVREATDWSEKEFIHIVYEDYRFEYLLGSAFLSVTRISGIYESIADLLLSLGYVGTIRAVSSKGVKSLKEKAQSDFDIIFKNRDGQKLRQQFCAYYGLS